MLSEKRILSRANTEERRGKCMRLQLIKLNNNNIKYVVAVHEYVFIHSQKMKNTCMFRKGSMGGRIGKVIKTVAESPAKKLFIKTKLIVDYHEKLILPKPSPRGNHLHHATRSHWNTKQFTVHDDTTLVGIACHGCT